MGTGGVAGGPPISAWEGASLTDATTEGFEGWGKPSYESIVLPGGEEAIEIAPGVTVGGGGGGAMEG